ncbi:MAG: phosphate/phosphite/phosphonate ABC transporter substrate-binding protein [Nitrospirota bacterium]|nr:phosphate/phosphite/phosphonate ABC transporter substrate-binding protein [Nitrospirota bacterium]
MPNNRIGLLVTVLMVILFLFPLNGCKHRDREVREKKIFGQQELLIGLIPEQNIFRQRERYLVLRKYLSERLGINVTFTSLSRYGNIIERFTAEKMDGAFFGSFTYALAHRQLDVEPIVRPVNLDGTSTYHGYIFTRKDSGIKTVGDMKGKRFAFVEHATTAGYLFPLAYFRDSGIKDIKQYLGQSFFSGSHDAAILAVLNKEADIGAAKNTIYDQLASENRRVEQELIVLAASGVVPQNSLAVRKDLDPELKKELKRILLEMDENSEGMDVLQRFGARNFMETTDKDYAYVYTLASHVGIDLKTYRYTNQ